MRKLFILFCLCVVSLYGEEVDYDCVVVGTSPTSMFEAIYQSSLGHRVLIVEQAHECGGAWKSIEICGVKNADMGCHEFGNAPAVKQFFREYAGCTLEENNPLDKKGRKNLGFYPAHGCYELIHNLQLLMKKLGAELLLNSRLETVFIDTTRKIAEVKINGKRYRTSKLFITNGAELKFENPEYSQTMAHPSKTKYPHVYLLIADPTAPRFTYTNLTANGASRAMNLTHYVGLEDSGKQLIAIQVHSEDMFDSGEPFLTGLKNLDLVDKSAEIIRMDHYVYEQIHCSNPQNLHACSLIEFLTTGHISQISSYIPKWKQAMKPWKEVMGD